VPDVTRARHQHHTADARRPQPTAADESRNGADSGGTSPGAREAGRGAVMASALAYKRHASRRRCSSSEITAPATFTSSTVFSPETFFKKLGDTRH